MLLHNYTPTVFPLDLPRVFGDGIERRRAYTITELPFDAFGAADTARPALVPTPGMYVNFVLGPEVVTAHAAFMDYTHELDGTPYPSVAAAERALYEAGVLTFRVYERDAAALGLPVGLRWAPHHTPAGVGCRWSLVSAPVWVGGEIDTDENRPCPAECPSATLEPVTLDPADFLPSWTFFGHWEDNRVVIEHAEKGEVDDDRPDDGTRELWAAFGTGRTEAEARAAVLAEYPTTLSAVDHNDARVSL